MTHGIEFLRCMQEDFLTTHLTSAKLSARRRAIHLQEFKLALNASVEMMHLPFQQSRQKRNALNHVQETTKLNVEEAGG